MTVCVATISGNFLFGATDRMITSGDVEFEPQTLYKTYWMSSAIAAMWAGDAGFNGEVLMAVSRVVAERVKADPGNWWNVLDVVELYSREWRAAKQCRAANAVLGSVGLTQDQFIAGKHGFSDRVVCRLIEGMAAYHMPQESPGQCLTEAIIMGLDRSHRAGEVTPQLYRLHDDNYTNENAVGFAAIGSGAWHANSQLMMAGYHGASPFHEGIWRNFVAKRRAEVAPGVGSQGTNMFYIGAQLGFQGEINAEWMAALEVLYSNLRNGVANVDREQSNGMKSWLDELLEAEKAKQKAGADSSQAAATPVTSSDASTSESVQT